MLQPDQTIGVAGHDAFGDHMIGVLLQPSLSSADRDQATGSRTSAFLLQALPQSRIMVGFGYDTFSRMERPVSPGRRSDGQIADSYIHTSYTRMGLWSGVCSLNLKGNQQVELLLGLIIPEFRGPDLGTLPNKGGVLNIAGIGDDETALQGQDREVLLTLEAVVLLILVGQRRGDILGSLVQSLVAFLGLSGFALCGILLDLGPQCFVGGSHLTRNATGHLGWQMKTGADLSIGAILQSDAVTHFAMRKSILKFSCLP